MSVIKKKCRVCGKTQPIGNYQRRKESRDGHRHTCKSCDSIQRHERWLRDFGYENAEIERAINRVVAKALIAGTVTPLSPFYGMTAPEYLEWAAAHPTPLEDFTHDLNKSLYLI